MKRLTHLVLACVSLVMLGWLSQLPWHDFQINLLSLGGGANTPFSSMSQSSKTPTQRLIDALPDGQSVKFDDFAKNVDSPLTSFIGWSSPQTITRTGKHVVVTLAQPASKTDGSVTVNLAQTIEFDFDLNASDLTIKNMTGVRVTASALLSNLELKEAVLAEDGNGNTTVTGKLLIKSWLPYATFKVKVDKDGNPVK